MNNKKRFFTIPLSIMVAMCSCFVICDYANAAQRTPVRAAPVSRKSTTTNTQKQQNIKQEEVVTEPEIITKSESEPEIQDENIANKSNQFETTINEVMESATPDNSFAEMIRAQRAALQASESSSAVKTSMKSGQSSCDIGLRQCMMKTCGNDFTKCALDGDTVFGDKLNKCRRDIECSGEEFKLFTTEIKADRDMNAKLSSYDKVVNCGNQYNACIVNECGVTYSKCLGHSAETAATQKCATIAKECIDADSGLASRVGTVLGKLRENAEKDVKKDEKRLYELRDLMAKQCTSLGAMFDERTFDCVYTVNFFAGENQTTPMASKKAYAGDSFICNQEWFGINATTYKENAYRETRAQTAASSAMLGSGVGTAVGLVTSGAVGRALETQKAKKELKAECESRGGKLKNGKCEDADTKQEEKQTSQSDKTPEKDKNNKNSSEKQLSNKDEQPQQQTVDTRSLDTDVQTSLNTKLSTPSKELSLTPESRPSPLSIQGARGTLGSTTLSSGAQEGDNNINSSTNASVTSFDSFVVDVKGECWHIKEYGYPQNDTEKKWRKPKELFGAGSIKIEGERQKTHCDGLDEWGWFAQIDTNTKITGTSRCMYNDENTAIKCECQIKDSESWETVLLLVDEQRNVDYCSGYCSAHCAANADILAK